MYNYLFYLIPVGILLGFSIISMIMDRKRPPDDPDGGWR